VIIVLPNVGLMLVKHYFGNVILPIWPEEQTGLDLIVFLLPLSNHYFML